MLRRKNKYEQLLDGVIASNTPSPDFWSLLPRTLLPNPPQHTRVPPLLRLPVELRLQIFYQHFFRGGVDLFPLEGTDDYWERDKRHSFVQDLMFRGTRRNILVVNRQIYREASAVLADQTRFFLHFGRCQNRHGYGDLRIPRDMITQDFLLKNAKHLVLDIKISASPNDGYLDPLYGLLEQLQANLRDDPTYRMILEIYPTLCKYSDNDSMDRLLRLLLGLPAGCIIRATCRYGLGAGSSELDDKHTWRHTWKTLWAKSKYGGLCEGERTSVPYAHWHWGCIGWPGQCD